VTTENEASSSQTGKRKANVNEPGQNKRRRKKDRSEEEQKLEKERVKALRAFRYANRSEEEKQATRRARMERYYRLTPQAREAKAKVQYQVQNAELKSLPPGEQILKRKDRSTKQKIWRDKLRVQKRAGGTG
jgi:hypothetical protein